MSSADSQVLLTERLMEGQQEMEEQLAKAAKTANATGVMYRTGAVRSADAEATAYTLISPIGLRRLAETYAEGAKKYDDYNWEKGMPVRDLLEHGIRHVFMYLSGDRTEDHLAHAAWNLIGAMHSEELWPDLNKGMLRKPGCIAPNVATAQKS